MVYRLPVLPDGLPPTGTVVKLCMTACTCSPVCAHSLEEGGGRQHTRKTGKGTGVHGCNCARRLQGRALQNVHTPHQPNFSRSLSFFVAETQAQTSLLDIQHLMDVSPSGPEEDDTQPQQPLEQGPVERDPSNRYARVGIVRSLPYSAGAPTIALFYLAFPLGSMMTCLGGVHLRLCTRRLTKSRAWR